MSLLSVNPYDPSFEKTCIVAPIGLVAAWANKTLGQYKPFQALGLDGRDVETFKDNYKGFYFTRMEQADPNRLSSLQRKLLENDPLFCLKKMYIGTGYRVIPNPTPAWKRKLFRFVADRVTQDRRPLSFNRAYEKAMTPFFAEERQFFMTTGQVDKLGISLPNNIITLGKRIRYNHGFRNSLISDKRVTLPCCGQYFARSLPRAQGVSWQTGDQKEMAILRDCLDRGYVRGAFRAGFFADLG